MAVGRKGEVMTDYIKREALEQRMYHEAFENDASYYEENPMARWDSGLWIRYKLFENVLANIPPSDVVERKHGEWIAGESWSDGYGMGEQYGRYYVCSECSHVVQDNYRKCSMNFCPNCGANMRIKQIELKK